MKPLLAMRCRPHGFTLAEIMMAMAIGSVVCATTITGVIFLQKSYAATEQYAVSMADEMRVLDYIGMDLRRGSAVSVDNTKKVLTIALPSYYTYARTDTNHRNPSPVLPTVATDGQAAVYSAGSGTAAPLVRYRFDRVTAQLQRKEFFTDDTSTPWQPVASQINDFPTIVQDSKDPQKYTVSVSFSPKFQTLDTPDNNLITLTSTVFLRNG